MSKIRALRDGYMILLTIITFLRDHQPLRFFGAAGILLLIGLGLIVYLETYCNFPRHSLLYTVLIFSSLMSFMTGLILNVINTRIKELESIIHRKNFLRNT